MASLIRPLILVSGGLFALIGLVAFFAPERFASTTGLLIDVPTGSNTIRSMVGAHYLAMGGMCIFGVLRNRMDFIMAVGLIEAAMVAARIFGMLNGEASIDVLAPTVVEIGAAGLLLWLAPKAQ